MSLRKTETGTKKAITAGKRTANQTVRCSARIPLIALHADTYSDVMELLGRANGAVLINVTPKLAGDLIVHMSKKQRKLVAEKVSAYADELKQGRWLISGDACQIDWDGEVINANHRLHAIKAAGIDGAMFFVGGLDPKAYYVIDTGKRRMARDFINDLPNASELVHLAATLLAIQNNNCNSLNCVFDGKRGRNQGALENVKATTARAHEEDFKPIIEDSKRVAKYTGSTFANRYADAILLIKMLNRGSKLTEFVAAASEENPSSNAVIAMRKRVIEYRNHSANGQPVEPTKKFYTLLFLQAYEAYCNGDKSKKLEKDSRTFSDYEGYLKEFHSNSSLLSRMN